MPYDPTTEPDLLPCQGVGGDLYFSIHLDEIARAKAACSGCPVRPACLHGAMERGEPCGVWGGELLEHGTPIAAPRRPGRPRKVAVA